jgi:hypothetical protein
MGSRYQNEFVPLHQAHRSLADFRGKSVRALVYGSIFSRFGASSIPGRFTFKKEVQILFQQFETSMPRFG